MARQEDLFDRLGDHRHRLEQHAEDAQRRVDLDEVFGLAAPAFRHEAVDLLDPALGVLAVGAHVPLAHRTVGAGNRVRTAHDPDHQVTLLERTAVDPDR